jgi:transglutaminase-like putative cysteine protease
MEEVKLLGGSTKRLLRIEKQVTEKVQGASLPAEINWLDEQGEPIKREMEIPGIGPTTFYRTSQDVAKAKSASPPVEISVNQVVRMSRIIPRVDDTRKVIYRVRLIGVEKPDKAFATDERQEIRNLQGDQFEIVVHGRIVPSASDSTIPSESPRDYLRSNHFIRSDDAKVRELATRAVGMTLAPWLKATRVVQWVYANMTKRDFAQSFTPADELARKPDGDCRQHAVLACAMCRGAGVPARTALGLVHSPADRGMIFHMWIEVWVNGRWYALDPTRGDRPVAAGHIKISDQSWNDETSLKPFLAVTRVLGKLEIEVAKVEYDSQ